MKCFPLFACRMLHGRVLKICFGSQPVIPKWSTRKYFIQGRSQSGRFPKALTTSPRASMVLIRLKLSRPLSKNPNGCPKGIITNHIKGKEVCYTALVILNKKVKGVLTPQAKIDGIRWALLQMFPESRD